MPELPAFDRTGHGVMEVWRRLTSRPPYLAFVL